jgi:NAD(P)H-hydrate epimerase
MRADRTVTMAALKSGLLQGRGPELSGRVTVADIGIPTGRTAAALIEDADADPPLLVPKGRRSHKWQTAVMVVAGSPGMEGAAGLCSRGASRAGAGMVRLAVPGSAAPEGPEGAGRPGPWPVESVRLVLGEGQWAGLVAEELPRCKALVIGPGLGRSHETCEQVRRLISRARVPVVADADALYAMGSAESVRAIVAASERPVVLTPHDGEYERIAGEPPGADRIAAASRLAEHTGAVVLLKGSLTVVAAPPADAHAPTPSGVPTVLLCDAGSGRLATAGTGDVLSGVIGAFVARGVRPHLAAALAAHVHGRAASSGRVEGLTAPDLPDLVSAWLSARLSDG